MNALLEIALVALLAVASFFILVGSFGLVKLGDFFKRLHGPTKASTLGVGCVLLASVGYHALLGDGLQLRELLVTVFVFITAPISAHMMAKAALSLMMESRPQLPQPPAAEPAAEQAPHAGTPRQDGRA
ncbi:Na+/H+ antiporter subunit G [Pseudoxanthomonas wuyuanensis]|uniref:Multisubunit potassium/proton antiporter, PhaG subunit n=1 Tax=Pseudoxanthomonas wuyuanensis TaxID=1073196 RepID=A0A286D6R1_9GAMM|nr:Na+/H+ antiporter subunit G [Pseudoxanthomonas wuyuanensis]KAF1719105.1 Na+/H+ antiporter subunit G [Pseudoxanthomonas wuyuanensis]SOD54351.1 multisubunit potassium/proton antiporter, PhaG subunit [Pseudoxanthomonas wuyuanensis]